MRHVLSALVQNQPGVLAHVSGMFASRGFNIDSLAVGETEDTHLSRITVVVMGDDRHLEQVRKQLEKIVTVVKVHDISREDYVERDLMLIKIRATPERRSEVQGLVEIFRGRVVDVSPELMMIEIAGQEKKIEAFIEAVRPYGIVELARTGRIALVRGDRPVTDPEPSPLESADDRLADPVSVVGHSHL
jgi:acetolactate synthase-1/3 small subunit